MKKSLSYKFNHNRYLREIEETREELVSLEEDASAEVKSTDSLLQVIYAPDPISGLPTGDLGYLVNDKANPQVKQFILSQLQMDISGAANPTIPDGIDDSLALDLSRHQGESLESYATRLNSFSKSQLDAIKIANDVSSAETPLDAE